MGGCCVGAHIRYRNADQGGEAPQRHRGIPAIPTLTTMTC